MKKIILCDLDDTLIRTQQTYDIVTNKTVDIIVRHLDSDVNRKEVLETFKVLDVENMKKYKMAIRYPKTFVEVLEMYAKKKKIHLIGEQKEEVYEKASEIFTRTIPLYDGAVDFVNKIRAEHNSVEILTMGDKEIQKKRLIDVQIDNYFDDVHIIEYDKTEVLKNAMNKVGQENVVMIGNSLKSDIKPSLDLNIHAIHIERNTWAFDQAEINKEHEKYHLTKNYQEIENKLKMLGYII